MTDKANKEEVLQEHGRRRREFVVKSAKVAVTAPAISLLLSGSPETNAIADDERDFLSGRILECFPECRTLPPVGGAGGDDA